MSTPAKPGRRADPERKRVALGGGAEMVVPSDERRRFYVSGRREGEAFYSSYIPGLESLLERLQQCLKKDGFRFTVANATKGPESARLVRSRGRSGRGTYRVELRQPTMAELAELVAAAPARRRHLKHVLGARHTLLKLSGAMRLLVESTRQTFDALVEEQESAAAEGLAAYVPGDHELLLDTFLAFASVVAAELEEFGSMLDLETYMAFEVERPGDRKAPDNDVLKRFIKNELAKLGMKPSEATSKMRELFPADREVVAARSRAEGRRRVKRKRRNAART